MKLCRYGTKGQEKPGIVDAAGTLRSLSDHLDDLTVANITPEGQQKLRAIDIAALPVVAPGMRFGLPFTGTRQFIAIGLNYADHAAESNMAIPKEPVIFTKAVSCLQGPNDDVMIPKGSIKTDWEVELGIVIGSRTAYVEHGDALAHVAGYCVVHDVSEREFQLERGGTWDKGKGCETFGPVGPWLVTRDEIHDPQQLALWLEVNGVRMQNGNTRTMIFGVATLVSYLSCFMVLQPGDIITTGTPPGVGMGQKPPRFLQAGDSVRLGIENLGIQEQQIIGWRAEPHEHAS
jgi:2,4-diketo-3-deoxy-L-fuconate hydrolase